MKTIDARGLSCPQPVILTKKALDSDDEIAVLVSERSSAENVAEMARSLGAAAGIDVEGADFRVTIKRLPAAGQPGPVSGEQAVKVSGAGTGVAWVVNSEAIGRGDDELGRLLRKSFFGALVEVDARPEKLIFINSGVKLVSEGSAVLEPLSKLADFGVEILACGTCLDFYGLKDKVAVGSVSNMYNFIELLMGAGKVITF
ncbi:MAG: sulfurtransferase-like selenium metabolism protein YedF [Actinobacteria bacterium]|nr:sulfurtransferase-like selenium metabolism protein YedF [Actinomycetota bacterium]